MEDKDLHINGVQRALEAISNRSNSGQRSNSGLGTSGHQTPRLQRSETNVGDSVIYHIADCDGPAKAWSILHSHYKGQNAAHAMQLQ